MKTIPSESIYILHHDDISSTQCLLSLWLVFISLTNVFASIKPVLQSTHSNKLKNFTLCTLLWAGNETLEQMTIFVAYFWTKRDGW